MFSPQRGSVLIAIFGKDSSICWIFTVKCKGPLKVNKQNSTAIWELKNHHKVFPIVSGALWFYMRHFLTNGRERDAQKGGVPKNFK